jgi:hypothetical protein
MVNVVMVIFVWGDCFVPRNDEYKVSIMTIKHGGFVYIVTNRYNTVLYTGVTSELRARIDEHKTKFYPKSFTAKYNCDKIVW